MFSRTENFSQYIKFYPVVSTIIALNVIIHLLIISSSPWYCDI